MKLDARAERNFGTRLSPTSPELHRVWAGLVGFACDTLPPPRTPLMAETGESVERKSARQACFGYHSSHQSTSERAAQMTWIVSDAGTKWVEIIPRKRRASPKPKRFADVKVGDWLTGGYWSGLDYNGRKCPPTFFLVKHHWFDPVKGENDEEMGNLFAIAMLRRIDDKGDPVFGPMQAHTRRGLASQKYHYHRGPDPIDMLRAKVQGIQNGSVLPLRRPKKRPSFAARPL